MRIATDSKPEPLPGDARRAAALTQLVLDGHTDHGIAVALGITVDEVRAMVVRLAK